jgi:predicted MFS family arabinose efflux permease
VSGPTDAATDPAGSRPAWRVVTQRDFGVYFAGSALSNIGTWFQNIAAGLLIYELTGSTLLVGAVNFAQFLGAFVLAPWAGAAADRFDRRKLLMVTQVGAATVGGGLAVLTFADLVTPAIVVGAASLLGLALAFMVPALLALVPLLVDGEDLDAAVSLNSVTFNLARAVGPVLGALVVEQAGYGFAFALNAASFLAFVVALALVRPRPQERATGPRPRLLESVRMVRRQPVWTALLVAVVAVSTATDPINTITPELAIDVFDGRALDAGLLVGAFGAGATTTALTLTGWLRTEPYALPGAMVVQAAGMIGVGLAPAFPLALLAMAVSGGGFIAAITRSTARLQLEVPDLQRGRVMALWSIAFVGTRPFAALLDGAVAEAFGARTAAVVLALPPLLAAPWVLRRLRAGAGTAAHQGHSSGGGTSVAR